MFCEFCGNTVTAGTSVCAACTPVGAAAVPSTSELSARASVASRDAWQALKRAIADPVGNIGTLHDALGARRALDTGIALAVAFDLTMVVAVQIGARKTLGFLAPLVFGNSSVMSFVKSMIFAAVPVLTLMAVLLAFQKIFTGTADVSRAVFGGAVTLMPLAVVSLLSAILGAENVEVILILVVALLSYTSLILFAACRDVAGLSSGKAAAVMPLVFIATGWLSKIVIAALV